MKWSHGFILGTEYTPIVQRELPIYIKCKVKNCYVILSLAEDIGGKHFSLCEEDDWKEYKISGLGQRFLKKLREKVRYLHYECTLGLAIFPIIRRLSSSQRSESDILGSAIPLTV